MNSKISYKTALITGGNGNIGRLISERLVAQGVRVVRFDIPGTEPADTHELETIVVGDIRDDALLQDLFQQHQPDIRCFPVVRKRIWKPLGKLMAQLHFD